mgnify:FL=1
MQPRRGVLRLLQNRRLHQKGGTPSLPKASGCDALVLAPLADSLAMRGQMKAPWPVASKGRGAGKGIYAIIADR